MKNVTKSVKPVKRENDLFSFFSEKEILCLQAMSCVRGGTAGGYDPIIIIPPKP